jgi:hypothetical protein
MCDNLDNNCNGFTDEDLTRDTTCGLGECAGNTGEETCTDGVWGGDTCDPVAGATAEVCDNLDNNCNDFIDEDLTRDTTCGLGECAGNTGEETCTAGVWGGDTCDPLAGATAEMCDNLDNNCNGFTDEDLTRDTICGVGECASMGIETCTAGIWGDDTCTAGTPTAEICDNKDNNCDGNVDEDLTQSTSCGAGTCSGNTGQETCSAGVWGDDTCDPLAGATAETCNNVDDDCDGVVDEGLLNTFYADLDEDNFGDPNNTEEACSAPTGFVDDDTDCDDGDETVYPGADEVPGDCTDQDCDGNDPPLANAGADRAGVPLGNVNLSGAGTDCYPAGDTLTVEWGIILMPDSSAGQLLDRFSFTPNLNVDAYGTFEIEIEVCDPWVCDYDTVVITTQDNVAPTADAGDDIPANQYDIVCVEGNGGDANGDLIEFSWTFSGPDGNPVAPVGGTQQNPCILVDQPGVYLATLRTFDGLLYSLEGTANINVDENTKPVVAADFTLGGSVVPVGTEVCIDGSNSYDPDNDSISTYGWMMTFCPQSSGACINNPIAGSSVCFTPDVEGDFQWQLSVTDEHGAEGDPLAIVVTAEQVLVSVPNAYTCAEFEAVGLVCDELYECNDTAPEGQIINQTLEAGDQVAPGSTVTLVISTGPCPVGVPGDLDGDGLVDYSDYMQFRIHLGCCGGDTNYNPVADYDGDGCITYNDFGIWYSYYFN